jgi:hypothetical protein
VARLLLTRVRTVPPSSRAAYDSRWEELRRSATARGAHAWRFLSTILPDRYVEFLEFAHDADPRTDPDVAGAARRLDLGFPAEEAGEWREG